MRPLLTAAAFAALFALTGPLAADTTTPAATPPATPAAATTADTATLPAITVTSVTKRNLSDHILASGLIGPVELVQVQPLIEGQPIESLAADVGDTVTAGQVLATLSTATLTLQKSQLMATAAATQASIAQAQAQLVSAQSNADEAKRTADRTATLMAQGSATNTANDQAKAALTSANANVTVAQQSLEAAKAQVTLVNAQLSNIDLQLSRARVVAPFAGTITARNAQIGAVASANGQAMFTIVKDGALELRADVAEADMMRVTKDQTATLTLASGDSTITGKVRLIEPTIDTATRLGRARIWIDDETKVRSGMFASADILVTTHDAIAVPVTAVGSEGSETTVMAVKDGLVSRVVVQTGIRDGGWIEIISGLTEGESIVAKAGAFVADGDKINPVPAPAATN